MNLEIFILNGYGQYVWPAFLFSFLLCTYLYFKTKKELKEQEKIFLREFNQFQTVKIERVKTRKVSKEAFSNNSI
tara:strand:- start:120 stop:344 length:225 start_codon:yes stop_codon:yes gene_type:complete